MSMHKWIGVVVSVVLVTTAATTWGQRGMGNSQGVVRQGVETQRITLQGTVEEIITETCEKTTGPFNLGMHLLITAGEGKQYNVHLGPAVLVKDLVGPLKAGQSVTVQAFRTAIMPAEHFVAIVLTFDGMTVRLRDENLRPLWAGQQGQFLGRYGAGTVCPRPSQTYGRGYGMGNGRGYGIGYGRGMGGAYGRSSSMGYGQGQGGRGQGRGLGYGYGSRMCPWGMAPGCQLYSGW